MEWNFVALTSLCGHSLPDDQGTSLRNRIQGVRTGTVKGSVLEIYVLASIYDAKV